MRNLFICSSSLKGSPFAVIVARDLAKKYKVKDYEADSCGIEGIVNHKIAWRVDISEEYDKIFVMDKEMKDLLPAYGVFASKIVNLNLSDLPSVEEREIREMLTRELTDKLEPYFQELAKRALQIPNRLSSQPLP